MIIFDGKKSAQKKERELARQFGNLKKKLGMTPKLVAIQVGKNQASEIYLRIKEQTTQRVGIKFEKIQFSAEVKPQKVISFIKKANKDKDVRGIIIQLPLPKQFSIINSQFLIFGTIVPSKDIDCLTPENLGLLMMGQPRFLPATVKAVVEIICESAEILGKNVVIIGGSNIVGKPLAMVLSNMGATVTICRSKTKNLEKFTSQADILISATGVPKLIKKEMVKKGAIVIDVGSPQGDVDFENVKKVASFLTPVPNGVGPMTVACLLENIFEAALLA